MTRHIVLDDSFSNVHPKELPHRFNVHLQCYGWRVKNIDLGIMKRHEYFTLLRRVEERNNRCQIGEYRKTWRIWGEKIR